MEELLDYILKGGSLDKLIDAGKVDPKQIYAAAHGLYIKGCYSQALPLFGWLVVTHNLDCRYLFAFASCLQMLRRYESALRNYLTVSILEPSEPRAIFHACECLIGLNKVDEACQGLDLVLELCGSARHEPIRKRAEALRTLMVRRNNQTTAGSENGNHRIMSSTSSSFELP